MSSSPPPSFFCNICKRDDRFDPSWIHHLATLQHQRALTRQPLGGHGLWTETDSCKRRAVEVVGCHELQANPIDIAEYLTKQGGWIEEFICPTSLSGTKPKVVSCLFKEAESVDKILGIEEHKIFRQSILIQRKYDSQDYTKQDTNLYVKNEDWENEGGDSVTLQVGKACDEEGEIAHAQISGEVKKNRHQAKSKRILPALDEQMSVLNKCHHSDLRAKIVKDIQKVVVATFSNSAVYSYGSDFIGVCLDSDDLRICIDPYGKFNAKSNNSNIIRNPSDPMACGLIFQILSTSKNPVDGSPKFAFVSQYSTSSVLDIPEISFKQTVNQQLLPCKLQFENFLSVQKSRMLKFYCNHDIRVGPLFSMIRLWSNRHKVFHELREGEEFEGYILIMLIVFYLTKIKFLPSAAELRELGKDSPRILDNINVSFCSNRKQIPGAKVTNDQSVRTLSIIALLKEFFQFFATLNFTDNVVCPSIGMILESKAFRPQVEKQLPQEILKYYRRHADGSARKNKLEIYSPMIVQDILELTDNVARAVDDADLIDFQIKCGKTFKFLEGLLKKGNGNLAKYFSSKGTQDEEENEYSSSSEEEDEDQSQAEIETMSSECHVALDASPPSTSLSSPGDCEPSPPSVKSPSPTSSPLQPPPAPFQIPGMPMISTATKINVRPTSRRSAFMPPAPPPPRIGGLQPPLMSCTSINDTGSIAEDFSVLQHSPDAYRLKRDRDDRPINFELQFSSPKLRKKDQCDFKRGSNQAAIEKEPICRILRDPRGGGEPSWPESTSDWKKKTEDRRY